MQTRCPPGLELNLYGASGDLCVIGERPSEIIKEMDYECQKIRQAWRLGVACFAATQIAEKAVKALYQALGVEA